MFVYIVYKSNTIYKVKSIYPLKQKMILESYTTRRQTYKWRKTHLSNLHCLDEQKDEIFS